MLLIKCDHFRCVTLCTRNTTCIQMESTGKYISYIMVFSKYSLFKVYEI